MTSLRSRTRVCRHTVVCGRLAGGMGPGASPGASPFLPLLSWVGWGFVAERRPARLRFAFLPCGVRVPGWRAWRVGWRFGRLLRIFVLLWCCLVAADGGRRVFRLLRSLLFGMAGLLCESWWSYAFSCQ